jgi:YD repeat-containing protein
VVHQKASSTLIASYTYDARGNRTSVTDALQDPPTSFDYDVMNRLKKITQPGNATTQFVYDTRGRRTSVTDPNNKTTQYGYDDADRLTSVTDAALNMTSYQYDTENHLASITDAMNPPRITGFSYDSLGRVTKVTFPSTLTENYTYDAVGNLKTKQDRKNQTITYNYDNLDRLTSKVYPDTTSVSYTYDNDSRLTQAVDPTGTYAFSYDNLGRLTGTTTNYSFLASRTLTVNYTYDAGSNRLTMSGPETGPATSYVYDTLNRLTSLTDFNNVQFGFSYDALGRRTGLTRPSAFNTTYTYDTLSRLLSVAHQKTGSTLSYSYSYDAGGNRTSQTRYMQAPGFTTSQVTSNYSYDALYELTQVVQAPTTTEGYTYDRVGNRLSSLGGSYTYNSSNQMLGSPGVTYGYDNNGNLASKADSTGTTSYTWDFENRLTSVMLPGTGGTLTFKYDPFGRRIYKASHFHTSVFAYDGDNIIEELDATGASVARYTQSLGIDEPLAMYRSGAGYAYHADGLGSIGALTDASGNIPATYVYDSFGNQTSSTGSVFTSFRYTAREYDAVTCPQSPRTC